MSNLRVNITMSIDGFVAGPDQSLENPLGVRGEELHRWMTSLAAWREAHGEEGGEENASSAVVERWTAGVGAMIMGRKMFGGGPGPWREDEPWTGWWGENPPFHHPVFVLSHHAREPLELQGGTTFHFVTDGIHAALERARAAAGDADVQITGGASVVQQYLAAGLVNELHLSVVPVLLGAGERLFANLGDPPPRLEQVRAIEAPGVAHIVYRVA
jgi:dihydrofolate reductase